MNGENTMGIYNEKNIGERIALGRSKINLSRADLAELMAVSVQAVGKWERGESLPDIITLKMLSDVFKEDINFFFGEETVVPAGQDKEIFKQRKWDMSAAVWKDADFSGLTNLSERFKSSNIKKCKFIRSDLSGITFRSNSIQGCDFSGAKISSAKFSMCNMTKNNFSDCIIKDTVIKMCHLQDSIFSKVDFTDAEINGCSFNKNDLGGAVFNRTIFINSSFNNLIIDSDIADCSFVGCLYKNVQFSGVNFKNTFFKNQTIKKTIFNNCTADSLTYAFLKNSKADLSGIRCINEK